VGAGSQLAEGRAAQHQLAASDAQQIGEVGRAVRELEDLDRAVDAGQRLGEPGAEPRPEGREVERLAGPDRGDLGGGLLGPRLGQGTPPCTPSTAPVVKLDAAEAK